METDTGGVVGAVEGYLIYDKLSEVLPSYDCLHDGLFPVGSMDISSNQSDMDL